MESRIYRREYGIQREKNVIHAIKTELEVMEAAAAAEKKGKYIPHPSKLTIWNARCEAAEIQSFTEL